MLILFLQKISVILDFFKFLVHYKATAVTIAFIGLITVFIYPTILKNILMINFTQKQIISNNFYNQIENILDEKLEYLNTNFLKNNPNAICIAEYIQIRNNPENLNKTRYQGQVMVTREFDRILQKVTEVRENRLDKTHRWIDYGDFFSTEVMENDIKNYPYGSVKNIENELLSKDDKYAMIMAHSFRGESGTGNFNFLADSIFYSFLRDISINKIIGHPIFICNKEAMDLIPISAAKELIIDTHHQFVSVANQLDETGSQLIV